MKCSATGRKSSNYDIISFPGGWSTNAAEQLPRPPFDTIHPPLKFNDNNNTGPGSGEDTASDGELPRRRRRRCRRIELIPSIFRHSSCSCPLIPSLHGDKMRVNNRIHKTPSIRFAPGSLLPSVPSVSTSLTGRRLGIGSFYNAHKISTPLPIISECYQISGFTTGATIVGLTSGYNSERSVHILVRL